jgi:hypothetical protein
MITPTRVLLAAALLAVQVRADYAFVECANLFLVGGILTGLINIITTIGGPADSVTGCPVSTGSLNLPPAR